MREFFAGVRTLFAGFGWWRVNAGVMAAGLIPALIVSVLAVAALVAWGFALPGVVDWATPWAAGWADWLTITTRILFGVALFIGALALIAATFTAVTLMVGEPFYDRVWKSVERTQFGEEPDVKYSFWSALGDALGLIFKGLGIAILAFAIGLVPLVGGIAGAITSLLLGGWVLADELSQRALAARGLGGAARASLRKANRSRTLGFGVATSLCFLIPLGAVVTMPAAVAGSTLLAHDLLKNPRPEAPPADSVS